MSISKFHNSILKIQRNLEEWKEKESLSQLEKDYLQQMMRHAYDELSTLEVSKTELPQEIPVSKHVIFDDEGIGENKTLTEKPKESKKAEVEKQESKVEAPSDLGDSGDKRETSEVKAQPQIASKETSLAAEDGEAWDEIFEIKESQELSDRLSQMPITDIWKAMGLNERIFTQNELFDGDGERFQQTVQKLNGMGSFDEATDYLKAHCVGSLNWMDQEKKKIAQNFIRLIRRRYA